MRESWKSHLATAVVTLLIGVTLGYMGNARPAPLNDLQAATIYALARSVSHLPLPEVAPVMHPVSKAKLAEKAKEIGVCPKGCPTIKAFQIQRDIYFDEALDMQDVQNPAILMHEMIHYLQYNDKLARRTMIGAKRRAEENLKLTGDAETCQEWVDREVYAYQMQNLVLYKANAQAVQMPAMPICKG